MYLNDYSVRIMGGNEVPGGYVEMSHGSKFSLVLRNDTYRKCDARVEVNGIHVGTWRLNPHQSSYLTRPANNDGEFTFYRSGSSEAYAVQPVGGAQYAGLVQVTFTPEREVRRPDVFNGVATASVPNYRVDYTSSSTSDTNRSDSYTAEFTPKSLSLPQADSRSSGVIGLSGHSSQQYGSASEIEYDYTGQTIISLRLICINDDGPRPLTQLSNPVPPPVR